MRVLVAVMWQLAACCLSCSHGSLHLPVWLVLASGGAICSDFRLGWVQFLDLPTFGPLAQLLGVLQLFPALSNIRKGSRHLLSRPTPWCWRTVMRLGRTRRKSVGVVKAGTPAAGHLFLDPLDQFVLLKAPGPMGLPCEGRLLSKTRSSLTWGQCRLRLAMRCTRRGQRNVRIVNQFYQSHVLACASTS